MEKNQHPNRCATAVFGHKRVGMGDIPAMGILECAGWRDPSIYTARAADAPEGQVHVGSSSALNLSVAALMGTSKYGQEGQPANQDEADKVIYKKAAEVCFKLGMCSGCNRFIQGEPIILRKSATE